jgi:tRNA(adenine34) deaminase
MVRDDNYWMGKAIDQAKVAQAKGEVPIGAVIVKDGAVIARGHNLRESNNDPAAHAEMIAIRKAAKKLASWRLTGATLYVTLEPCTMCMGAVILSRLDRVVFGSYDPKGGAAGSLFDFSNDKRLNHSVILTPGVRGDETSALLSNFFAALRARKKRLKEAPLADAEVVQSCAKPLQG